MSPGTLRRLLESGAAAVVPWGALEWHGDHLPLGLDGIVAEHFADELAERILGVSLPGIWLPITTLPHPSSLKVSTSTLRAVLDDTIGSLYEAGFRRVVLVTGHYAQGHLIEMYEAAMRAMEDYDRFLVFAGTPLQPLGNPHLLDHAARYEVSQLLAIRPDLVWTDDLPDRTAPREDGVLGEHPGKGNRLEGERLLMQGLDAWQRWIKAASRSDLDHYYRRAFDELQPYVDAYYTDSWDEALEKWWATK